MAGAVIPCVWEAGISGWFEAMGVNTLRMVKTLRPHPLCVAPWSIKPDLRPRSPCRWAPIGRLGKDGEIPPTNVGVDPIIMQ